MVANSNSETIVKVAPTTIVSKKTPVTPLPTKPRQQNQVDLNSHQNHQNLQHQPLQNLSQQNHSLTNASDNSGVQVKIKYPTLMQALKYFLLPIKIFPNNNNLPMYVFHPTKLLTVYLKFSFIIIII